MKLADMIRQYAEHTLGKRNFQLNSLLLAAAYVNAVDDPRKLVIIEDRSDPLRVRFSVEIKDEDIQLTLPHATFGVGPVGDDSPTAPTKPLGIRGELDAEDG